MQLQSGCLTTKPKTLEDYDDKHSNIDIETAFENYARHKFSSNSYAQMKDKFAKINIATTLYDPELQLPQKQHADAMEEQVWVEYCRTGELVRDEEIAEAEEDEGAMEVEG